MRPFNYKIDQFNLFIDDFKSYQALVEERLLVDLTNKRDVFNSTIESKYRESLNGGEVFNDEDFWEFKGQEEKKFLYNTSYYTNSFRASLLVQLYSIFEYELLKVCNTYACLYETDYKVKDLKGSTDIDKSKLYLKKTCKVDFAELNEDWAIIQIVRKLRNRIVHHQSRISIGDNDWKEIENFITCNFDKMSFDVSYRYTERDNMKGKLFEFYITNENLSLEFIEVIKRFFKTLLMQVNTN